MRGYVSSVILQRSHERAMRVWWDRTHKASLARPPRKQGEETPKPGEGPTPVPTTTPGKADEGANASAPAAQLKGYPAGKVLSQAEVGLSRQHAPLDAQGEMKCWDASSHMGCKMTAAQCSRSHEIIRIKGIHLAVQAQLLHRGGIRSGPVIPPITRWTRRWQRCAEPPTVKPLRIASLRKRGRIPRKLGPQNPVRSPHRRRRLPAPAEPQGASTAAHVGASVPTWSPPEEYLSFDCTPMEETLRQCLLGPDPTWRQDHHQGREHAQGAQPTDPLVKVRQEALDAVAASPQGQAVAASPDRLRAYVHTRLAEARLGH